MLINSNLPKNILFHYSNIHKDKGKFVNLYSKSLKK